VPPAVRRRPRGPASAARDASLLAVLGGTGLDEGDEDPTSHTTHFVIADSAGNIVTATQTLGGAFGSRIMPEGTGIWLNNSLSFCTFEPKGNPMDAHPGRRKLSGDCPTIVVRGGRPWAALGTPGGHTIGQTVPQMVMNLVDFKMDVLEAVAAPRVSFIEPDTIAVEPGIPEGVRAELEAKGHKLRSARGLGNAHALTIEYGPNGKPARFKGASDPRGSGLAKEF
jgi:gamma-glutamyltranspeptidase/glutathione hydrolase